MITATHSDQRFFARYREKPLCVFAAVWCILAVLYASTARAGWVLDTTEWLQRLRQSSLKEFMNVKQSRGSMYQFTQFCTYIVYHIIGEHRSLWRMLFVTMHALNCTLLFVVWRRIFSDAQLRDATNIALGGVLLFAICPHVSEVVVWIPSYHYLQAMLLCLAVLWCLLQYLTSLRLIYPVIAFVVFALSTFAHEFFYLTPLFAAGILLHYRLALNCDKKQIRAAFAWFVVPMVVAVAAHTLLLAHATGSYTATLQDEIHQTTAQYLRKPPLYFYHTVFFGRYYTEAQRAAVYTFFSATWGLILFYAVLIGVLFIVAFRYKKMQQGGKVAALLFVLTLLSIAMVCPVWFPDSLLVAFDRYTYFMLPFIYLLIVLAFARLRVKEWGITFFIVYGCINLFATMRLNKDWRTSGAITDKLVYTAPVAGSKILLLLNAPGNMNGITMLDRFGDMHQLWTGQSAGDKLYEVVSYNMRGPHDGAHVMVINDSMLHVTLNQWATWWWRGSHGAESYETADFRCNMIDVGHWYELTLKKPADQYLLLYQVGDKWKTVNWENKNHDQE